MDACRDDVSEFAFLLTRLKERTDRSYAALARRLDMNASTLHRYCAGEMVPLEFATVERFAELCAASPEERRELHRRWILAVAERQRRRSSRARRVPGPRGTTSGPADPASGGLDGLGGVDGLDGQVGPDALGDHDTPDARREATPERLSAPESLRGPTPEADGRQRARSPRRLPLRSMAMAASLVVLPAGLTASAGRPPVGPTASAASEPLTPRLSASSRPRAGRTDVPAVPSPEGTEPSATVRTSGSPSAPAAHGGGDASKDPENTGTAPSAGPLTWTADSHVWRLECDHDYVIAKPPEQVPPPMPADAAAWASSLGAVHGRTTDLRITVQGRGSAEVVLTALHVRMADRAAPARQGIAYSMYEGCGAVLIPRYFSVDLDAPRPLVRSVPGNDPDRPAPAIDFPYRVSLQKPEVLFLSARTGSCTCDWYVDLDWSAQGRTGTVRIDDHGRPFRTTTIDGLPHYWYRRPQGWVPMTTTSHAGPDAAG
ncbi:helix-turn-helix domain-containing protein [Streptomyces mangrovisoli]|uniref:Transcriptional regulator n=1 Tax=Streptomyces mangrovisoli TaxID=1428628 RepID=A0A1J4NQU7_9ACTN|nr:helix-turn-helix transcriptional regulator [Streptomyces mangrovisoli]OIJ63621.1 hypothetical protein WN71_032890 [Streptomyces mangrovisoli]